MQMIVETLSSVQDQVSVSEEWENAGDLAAATVWSSSMTVGHDAHPHLCPVRARDTFLLQSLTELIFQRSDARPLDQGRSGRNEIKQHRHIQNHAAGFYDPQRPSTVTAKNLPVSCTPIPKPGWPCPRWNCGLLRFPSIPWRFLQPALLSRL